MEKLNANAASLRDFDVATLRLFGSFARNQAHSKSDVDLLVKFTNTPNYDQFMDLKFYLEEMLGLDVDLVTDDAVRPELRQKIEKESLLVA